MNPAEIELTKIMDAYDRGEARAVDVALEASRTMGTCSQLIYERAEKILQNAYEGTEKKR